MHTRTKGFSWCAVGAALELLIHTTAAAQIGGVSLWTNFYGNALARDIAVDTYGNVFVTGMPQNNDFATVKYSATGTPLWTNVFKGPAASAHGYGRAIAADNNGNAFVTGYAALAGCVTIKYSPAGIPLWTNYLDAFNGGQCIAVGSGGNVFIGANQADYAVVAYANEGVPLWTNYYKGPDSAYDAIRAVAVDRSGNVLVTGYSMVTSGSRDSATIKYSGAGLPLWTNRYARPLSYEDATALLVDATGDVFVCGGGRTIKYSGDGTTSWTNGLRWGEYAAALDGSGNLYLAGVSDLAPSHGDFEIVKYSASGLPLWTNLYNGLDNLRDIVQSIAVDGSGNVFVTGNSYGADQFGDLFLVSYATVAYSSQGALLWSHRFPSTDGGAQALAVDPDGNVFVAGQSPRPGSGSQALAYVTIKFSSALPPRLRISRAPTKALTLSWPSPSTGFSLQVNTGLHPGNWTTVPTPVQDDGLRKTLIFDPPAGDRFFRLRNDP